MRDIDWDYIIVGAGAAGCVLAARLSENPAHRVLLIEAGGDHRNQKSSLNFREVVSWGGRHWPALKARFTPDRSPEPVLRGLGLGGSSAVHALTAIRGLAADFDAWGIEGWSWNDVLPAFCRVEDDRDFGQQPYHGSGGPLPLIRKPAAQWGRVARAFVEAAADQGYPWCDDINAPGATGVYAAPLTMRNGERVSSNDAYLTPVRDRPNLAVLINALVSRVEFSASQATGVSVGETIYSAGNVILCAGAIHSPAILMRSGIGNAADLDALGIPLLAHLPGVGMNLCEHPVIRLPILLRPEAQAASLDGVANPCGLRTGVNGASDNLTMFVSEFGASTREGAIGVSLMQPASRGRVQLQSAAPEIDPLIDFNLLADNGDLTGLQSGVGQAARLLAHPAFRAIGDPVQIPGDLRRNCQGFFHAAGTCRMGPSADPASVVDPHGFVIGVSGLRVADASIMPRLPRAATYLTTTMIAEHLATRILAGKRPDSDLLQY